MNLQEKARIALKEFRETPESVGHKMRLELTKWICELMRQKKWSQKQLAEAAGMKPSQLSKIIHADANYTFDVAGRILFALGLRSKDIAFSFDPQTDSKMDAIYNEKETTQEAGYEKSAGTDKSHIPAWQSTIWAGRNNNRLQHPKANYVVRRDDRHSTCPS